VSRVRVLLVTLGSHGDVHPFMALAVALRARGHEAVLATNPHFAAQAARAGIALEPLGGGLDVAEAVRTKGAMHPLHGTRVIMRDLLLPHVREVHDRAAALARGLRPDVAVVHPICLGAHWALDRAGVEVVPACLAPISWFGAHDPTVYGPWRSHSPAVWATRIDAWFGKRVMRLMLDGPLNRVRRELGYGRGRDLLIREFRRSGLNLGLWSPFFRGPCRGDPEGGVICGFPWFDAHHDHHAGEEELEQFLASGEPPIVFSLGTAAVHLETGFYAHAAEACRRLGKRGVLLIGRAEYAARGAGLPEGVIAVPYAPFSTLLPRAAAAVHHGGIGSTAQGLRAGRPTVICPLAHDQYDNAARAKRLGVSETLPHARVDGSRLAAALARVMEDPGTVARAAALGPRIAGEDGAAEAVMALERHLRTTPRTPDRGGELPRMPVHTAG
jgi:UDP:flavonoid glycosyltransferase YjiC (YdhE family)